MGYSIAVHVRNVKLRDQMMALLTREYRSWPVLNGGSADDPRYASEPKDGGLSYSHGRCIIGFDYNASGSEREYAYSLLRWIALKVGRSTPSARVQFYVYDRQAIGISVGDQPVSPRYDRCDKWGVRIPEPGSRVNFGRTFDNESDATTIRAEIQRIDALWKTTTKGE